MLETVKEVYEETFTKDNNTLLKKEPTYLLLSGNVDYSGEMNRSLTIKGDVREKSNPLGN